LPPASSAKTSSPTGFASVSKALENGFGSSKFFFCRMLL
jgi:hypothetical protein